LSHAYYKYGANHDLSNFFTTGPAQSITKSGAFISVDASFAAKPNDPSDNNYLEQASLLSSWETLIAALSEHRTTSLRRHLIT
jgi:hypothetical protein